MKGLVTGLVLALAAPSLCQGQDGEQVRTTERTVKATQDKEMRVGVYFNLKPDCSSGPLPTIRLLTPPASGRVTVKNASVKATNQKNCLAFEVPGYVAFYKSAPDFLGQDGMTLEIRYPGGMTEIQKITVNVTGPEGRT